VFCSLGRIGPSSLGSAGGGREGGGGGLAKGYSWDPLETASTSEFRPAWSVLGHLHAGRINALSKEVPARRRWRRSCGYRLGGPQTEVRRRSSDA
jgi:hypothetical protein